MKRLILALALLLGCHRAIPVGATGLPNSITPIYFSNLTGAFPLGSRDTRVLDGYASPSDGGGGLFVWNSTVTAANDSCTIVHPTGYSTGAWQRSAAIGNTTVNVAWCGTAGGTANYQWVLNDGDWYTSSGHSTKATDAVPQFSLAESVAASIPGGGTVYIPAGNWYFLHTTGPHGEFLVPVSNVAWKGDGSGSSMIRIAPGLNPGGTGYSAVIGTATTTTTTVNSQVSNVEISGIGVDCNSDFNQWPEVDGGTIPFGNVTYPENTAFAFPAGNNINIHHNAVTNTNGISAIQLGTYGYPFAATNSWVTDNLIYHIGDDPNMGDNSQIAVGGFRVHADRNIVDSGITTKSNTNFSTVLRSSSSTWPITIASPSQIFIQVDERTKPVVLNTAAPLSNLGTGSTSIASFVSQANTAATSFGEGTPFAIMALPGTFNVTNGSPTVTATTTTLGTNAYPTGVLLSAGDKIQFASQSGTNYTVSTVSSGTITLTGNYTGTGNAATTGTNQSRWQITGPFNGSTVQILNVAGSGFLVNLGLQYNQTAVGGDPIVNGMEVHGSESTCEHNIIRKCTTAINWGADSYNSYGFKLNNNLMMYVGNGIDIFNVGGFYASGDEFNDNTAVCIGGNGLHTVRGDSFSNTPGGGFTDSSVSRNRFIQLVSSHAVPGIDWEENATHLKIDNNYVGGFDAVGNGGIVITSEDTVSQVMIENEVNYNTLWRPGTYGILSGSHEGQFRVIGNTVIEDRISGTGTLNTAIDIAEPTDNPSQFDANECPYCGTIGILYGFAGGVNQYYPTRTMQALTVQGATDLDGGVTMGSSASVAGAFSFAAGLTVSATDQVNTTPIPITAGIYAIGVKNTGGPTAINLEDAPFLGRTFEVTDTGNNAATNHITINAHASEQFYPNDVDGGISYVINTNGASCKFTSLDGTNYYVTGGFNCP